MNTSLISKIASHLSIAISVVALLFASTVVRADDNQKKKNKSTTQSSSSGQKSSSSGSGGSHSNGSSGKTRDYGSSSGTSSSGGSTRVHKSGSSAETNSSGDSGQRHNKSGSNSTSTTGNIGGTSTVTGGHHKRDNNTSSTSATGSGGAGTGANSENKHKSGYGHGGSSATDATGTTRAGKSGKVTTANANPGFVRASNGKPEVYRGHDGSEARFRRDGTIREVHTRGMTIIHRPGGARTVIVDRPDRSRIVVNRFGHGYVQRPFLYRNHEFYNRTYYYRGRPYALYYRGYAYRGIALHGYVPYRYYSPAFYGWAYRPWYRPVRYNWGWFGSPWYGYYGRSYFTPYDSYPRASFWLTDYLISSSLQAAYEERLANQASFNSSAYGGQVVLTPEVKNEISNEVQRQLALENSESSAGTGGDLDMNSSGLPRMLAETSPGNPRIFVVGGSLDVTDNQGQDCTLTEGDVLRLSTPPSSDATSAFLQVLASKNQSCQKGSTVSVGFADLQEMQNHMRATIDRGLQDLQEHQGGLPPPPANAAGPPVQASFAPIAPPADANVTSELQRQAQEADSADRQVLNEVNQADNSGTDSGASSTESAEISLGQTMSEVEAILGRPKQIVNLGAKKMYVYPNMKITFVNGRVSDVQ